MKQLGIDSVPATVAGRDVVSGWNPKALADLVGVSYDDIPALSPEALLARLDRILRLAQTVISGLETEMLEVKHPSRDRTLYDLAYHVFKLSDSFVDAVEQARLLREWLVEKTPAGIDTGSALADFGVKVRRRFSAWKKDASPHVYEKKINTYYGEQQAWALLERTVWHAGQHLRQIFDLLKENGMTPAVSLDESLFEDLPMPTEVW